ncbi:MAG TPA: hypothetical protein VGH89_30145, partial [Pseudonocardia sp.]
LMRPGTNPLFTELAAKGHTTLIGLWQQVTVQAATQAYTNVFLIAGALTLLGAILAAVLLPTGNPAARQK